MTEQSRFAVGEHRRDPSALLAQNRMPDGIDLPVHQPETPAFEAALNFALREAKGDQLPPPDNPMLPLGQGHDLSLASNAIAPPARACLSLTTHTGR